ncbi:MAG: hypothetical protein IIY35_02480 [Ruminococcus sp.]|jgi:hypothetical protein|nr:hypothetical protein [Ruminococcus sp.]
MTSVNKAVKLRTAAISFIIVIAAIGAVMFFRHNKSEKVDIVKNGAVSVVPSKDELISNLTDEGYTISQFNDIYGLDVTGERVYAENGSSCIDICYNLSKEDALKAFKYYEEKYLSCDYYIIAQNENFVYYISDKAAFRKSGFKSTDNIGNQYIREN